MSAAADLRTALLDHAPLVALIDDRVRQDATYEDDEYPLIVFRQTGNEPVRGLDGSLHVRIETFQIESWGATRADSAEVHAVVEDALLAADLEADPADPESLDPDVGARACVWTVRVFT